MSETKERRRPARWVAAATALVAALAMLVAPTANPPVAHADAASRGGDFVPFTSPRTLWDTRGGAKLKAGATASINALNVGGIPAAGVSALLVRLTSTQATAGTWLAAYPHGTTRPSVSMVNVGAGETLSNT